MYTIIASHATEQTFEGIPAAHVAWLVGQFLAIYGDIVISIHADGQGEPT